MAGVSYTSRETLRQSVSAIGRPSGSLPPGDFSMPPPAGSPANTRNLKPRKLLCRFRRDQRGSAAVEFAMIATPFFALLFAIIETSIVFFAGQVLENGLQDSARLLYTHQAQDSGMTGQQFKDDLCARVAVLMSCSIIGIDVKFYAAGTAITITDPIDA